MKTGMIFVDIGFVANSMTPKPFVYFYTEIGVWLYDFFVFSVNQITGLHRCII